MDHSTSAQQHRPNATVQFSLPYTEEGFLAEEEGKKAQENILEDDMAFDPDEVPEDANSVFFASKEHKGDVLITHKRDLDENGKLKDHVFILYLNDRILSQFEKSTGMSREEMRMELRRDSSDYKWYIVPGKKGYLLFGSPRYIFTIRDKKRMDLKASIPDFSTVSYGAYWDNENTRLYLDVDPGWHRTLKRNMHVTAILTKNRYKRRATLKRMEQEANAAEAQETSPVPSSTDVTTPANTETAAPANQGSLEFPNILSTLFIGNLGEDILRFSQIAKKFTDTHKNIEFREAEGKIIATYSFPDFDVKIS